MPAFDNNRPWRKLYGKRWQKARLVHLAQHPLCVMCFAKGLVRAATVVDHSTPHRGNITLFWDTTKWQSLCYTCHNSDKQKQEHMEDMAGVKVVGVDGTPLDDEW